MAESLTEELNEYCWLEIFSDEKDINLVLDNVNIYKAILTKKITEILNITIIYLPKYASDLNPIERLWYSIKHILYNRFY